MYIFYLSTYIFALNKPLVFNLRLTHCVGACIEHAAHMIGVVIKSTLLCVGHLSHYFSIVRIKRSHRTLLRIDVIIYVWPY